ALFTTGVPELRPALRLPRTYGQMKNSLEVQARADLEQTGLQDGLWRQPRRVVVVEQQDAAPVHEVVDVQVHTRPPRSEANDFPKPHVEHIGSVDVVFARFEDVDGDIGDAGRQGPAGGRR